MTTNTEAITVHSLRHLDALVAENLMGWGWWRLRPCQFRSENAVRYKTLMNWPHERAGDVRDNFPFVEPADGAEDLTIDWDRDLPHYTTWAGVEAVIKWCEGQGPNLAISNSLSPIPERKYACCVSREQSPCYAPTIPIAVCLAALASAGCRVRLELGGEV